MALSPPPKLPSNHGVRPEASDTSASRQPRAQRPRRMDQLASLPLFFPLDGRRAVVIGGSEAAAWKAELLSAAGASVTVPSPKPCEEMEALAADPPGGPVTLKPRAWSLADLEGAALIVAAAQDDGEALAIFSAARAKGLPVNVIDKPAFCTFQFGAVVNRSPLVVGISTDGAAPIFGQAIRSRIEALLPPGFARWAEAAKAWRGELGRLQVGTAVRRCFWEAFAVLALQAPERAPAHRDWNGLLRAALTGLDPAQSLGHVTLVGAGPGDPELLTLKAARALRAADVILFDDLIAPEVLDFARREAKRMLVGKTGHRPSCKQDDINALMVSLAKAGKRVVRLKAGDPMIFGRAGEEIYALERAGIPFDVVPGISAAQGAAASLKVSLTHRSTARRVQFVTGHAHDGRLPRDLDLAALADAQATTAVYMPLGTLPDLVARLAAAGVEPDRPVCAVFNATRPDEQTVSGSVGTIVEKVDGLRIAGPCVFIVGAVLKARHGVRPFGSDTVARQALEPRIA
jgi:uroporphyrin-III C-methyltransferase/precorrin-2 dehydrogenase/sirohydrochlorin ferrochelatase